MLAMEPAMGWAPRVGSSKVVGSEVVIFGFAKLG